MNTRQIFVGCFLVTILIISWNDVTKCGDLPWPPRIIATGVVFGLLDLVSGLLGNVAPLVGVGIVLAGILNNKFSTSGDCQKQLAMMTPQPSSYTQAMAGTSTGNGMAVA